MKKNNLLILALAGATLVACNGGGSSNNNITALPLEISQNIIPSLNKIGSHQIWYMIVKNPNNFTVHVGSSNDNMSNQYAFRFDPANKTSINPTRYALVYDGAISGIATDCLSVINQSGESAVLGAGQSCAYKFEARWGDNQLYNSRQNFKMAYFFSGSGNGFIESTVCNTNNCLAGNQNLQFNLVLSKYNYNCPAVYANTAYGSSSLNSIDGNINWNTDVFSTNRTTVVSNINYNSQTNTCQMESINTYSGPQFKSSGSHALSTTGSNLFSLNNYQLGSMPNLSATADYSWIYGMDGNLYALNNSAPFSVNRLNQNQNPVNNTTSFVSNAGDNALLLMGVSAESNILVYQKDIISGTTWSPAFYCYYARDNYTQPVRLWNTNRLMWFMLSYLHDHTGKNHPSITPNGYYIPDFDRNQYFDLFKQSTNSFGMYKLDIDNCSVDDTNYFAFEDTTQNPHGIDDELKLNEKFGSVTVTHKSPYDEYTWFSYMYIESYNGFSNGLNGGN